jgi:Holliday junction resolvase
MVNSRAKGAAGERELSKVLSELLGTPFRRGVQYCGANGDADVVGLPGVHIEVKRVQALNVSKAMQQAMSDSKGGDLPIVAHRKNHEQWMVTCCLDDLIELSRVVVATVNRSATLESDLQSTATGPDTSPE